MKIEEEEETCKEEGGNKRRNKSLTNGEEKSPNRNDIVAVVVVGEDDFEIGILDFGFRLISKKKKNKSDRKKNLVLIYSLFVTSF